MKDLGPITDKQAARLRTWARDGFVVFHVGTAQDSVDPAAMALEQAFAGVVPRALFRCPALATVPMGWVPEITPHPAAALDLQRLSPAVETLLHAPMIVRFLTQVLGAPPVFTASEGMLRPIAPLPRPGQIGLLIGLDDPPSPQSSWSGLAGNPPVTLQHGDVLAWRSDLAIEPPVLTGLTRCRTIAAWAEARV